MKRCPTCNRTYTDDALSFCLDDGAPLLGVGDPSSSFDPNATMRYPAPRETTPPPTQAYRPDPPLVNQVAQPAWSPTPSRPYAPPTRKSSPLPWIIGGVVVLIVLGVGLIVLIAILASIGSNSNTGEENFNRSSANSNRADRNSNSRSSTSNSSTRTNENAGGSSTSTPTFSDDFSVARWWTGSSSILTSFYQNGEYHMRGAAKGKYVVQYGPYGGDYATKDATIRVTARSVDGESPDYGYGLVVHGELKNNQLEDYGFLIYTDENPAYEVVLHRGGRETAIVKWTRTPLIRTGTSSNQLEVRIKDKQLSFYINGQYVTSITDTANYMNGVVGFYTSDMDEVAFDNLEIYR